MDIMKAFEWARRREAKVGYRRKIMAFDLCHVDIRQLPNKRLSVGKIEHLNPNKRSWERDIKIQAGQRRSTAPFQGRNQSPKWWPDPAWSSTFLGSKAAIALEFDTASELPEPNFHGASCSPLAFCFVPRPWAQTRTSDWADLRILRQLWRAFLWPLGSSASLVLSGCCSWAAHLRPFELRLAHLRWDTSLELLALRTRPVNKPLVLTAQDAANYLYNR
jgi:hypothetical protein